MNQTTSLFITTITILALQATTASSQPQTDPKINEEIDLISFPPKFTNTTDAKFVFEIKNNTQSNEKVLCHLNQGQTYICTPDIEYVQLSSTRHILTYTLNSSNVAYEYEWQIDTQAPKITLWNGPQNKNFGQTKENENLSISVYVQDDTPVQLHCRLDNQEWAECWQPFIQIPKVDVGKHEFVIQATDSAGNSATEMWSWETQQNNNLYNSRRVLFPPRQVEGGNGAEVVDVELVGILPAFQGSAKIQQEYVSSNTEMAFCFQIGKQNADEQNWKLQCSLDFGESIGCGCGVKYQGLLPGRHIVQVQAYKQHSNQSTLHAQGWRAWWVHPILCTQSSEDSNTYIKCGNLQPVPAAGAWMRVGGTLPQEVMMKLPYFRQELCSAFGLVSQDSVQVLTTELVNSNETKIWMYLLQVDLTKEDKYQLVPLFDQVNLSGILTKSAYVQDAAVVEASKLVVPSTSDPPISQDLYQIQNDSEINAYTLQAYGGKNINIDQNNNNNNYDNNSFQNQESSSSAGLQSWALALVVVCSLVLILFFMLGGWRFWGQQKKAREADRYLREQMQQSDQDDISTQQLRLTLGNQVELFSYADVWKATDGFHTKNLLGEGGFGRVYKGQLNSNNVAVKRLDKDSLQGDKEFFMEVSTLSRMSHPNLVPIKGACVHGDIRICIMDLCANGSLRDRLDQKKGVQMLDWKRRIQILTGAAKGLHYLHNGLNATVVHRDFKSQNVLLDENWNARVGDFGIAKVLRSDNPNYATTGGIHGTLGYLAPEYRNLGAVTPKIDVFAFGVVIMEMLTSQNPYDSNRGSGKEALSDYFRQTFVNCDRSKLSDFLDVRIKDMDVDAVEVLCELGLSCTEFKDLSRSSMQEVLVRLQSLCQRYDIHS